MWIALQTMVMKSLEYPLPALTLTENECKEIMWIVLKTFLPNAGVNRYISRDLLYAGLEKQGLGLNNPFITQGLSHVADVMDHQWKKTMTGHLITESLEHMRLEIGCNMDILMEKCEKYEALVLTKSWIQNTWQFMSQYGIQLDEKTPKIPLAWK